MLTPEALARVLLERTTKAADEGRALEPMTISNSEVHALCNGLIWLAEGTYPPEWLSAKAVQSRKENSAAETAAPGTQDEALLAVAAKLRAAAEHTASVIEADTGDGMSISDLQASLHELRPVLYEAEVLAGEAAPLTP